MRTRTLVTILIALVALTTVGATSASAYVGPDRAGSTTVRVPPAARSGVPSKAQWLADVHRALAGAGTYVRSRSADVAPGEQLALNLDIDNSSIESWFHGGAIPEVLRLTRLAHRHGVAILFNTARIDGHRGRTIAQLRGSGYRVDGLCMRAAGETRIQSKQRCRAQFADAGYTLIANIGNNPTDFAGSGYERAFRLPNYGGLMP